MKIIILGATSVVGREILELISEDSALNGNKVLACASQKSKGKQVSFGNRVVSCEDFSDVEIDAGDIVVAVTKKSVLLDLYKGITSAGAFVVDVFGMLDELDGVPLVVSEINPQDISSYVVRGIVSSPGPVALQTLLAVVGLHKAYKIKRMVISTYEAVSNKGKRGMDELYVQTKKMFEASSHPSVEFVKQIAFNCIPQVGAFLDDGTTQEERDVQSHITRILGSEVGVSVTCVNVPVFNCHAESINIEFEKDCDMEQIKEEFFDESSVLFFDEDRNGVFKTQVECSKEDAVFVSRLRRDKSLRSGVSLWVVADNVRRGSAINAVKILKILVLNHLSR